MKVIMNPPYDKNLHLKILREAMKHSDDIVNLSPIRWLQDPLAEYKKNSDWFKFEDIKDRIESLEVIENKEASKIFGCSLGDLGIYHITEKGGYDATQIRKKSPLIKILNKLGTTFMDVASEEGYRGKYEGVFGIINSHYILTDYFISDDFQLFITPRYTHTNKMLKFKSEEERRNCFDYLTSKFMKVYASFIRINQRVPWQFVPYLDFSHKWTDYMLYEYFQLTNEEIEEIENEEGR